MSMHKLTAGDGYAYLTRHVAAGDAGLAAGRSLTAYYEQTGNPAGRWHGAGLTALGGEEVGRVAPGERVSEASMAAVFRDGVDPLTGASLGRSYTSQSAGSGARRNSDRHVVVGYDLTFTAPKSVSVLWGLADAATRDIVYAAHHKALADTLAFVEHAVIRTRVGAGGRRQVTTRGMIAAAFDHWDSRAGDPNLHTHVVIANKVQGPDGVWRSLDGVTVHAATVTVSELYDTLLADELTRRLPVAWSVRDRGPRRNAAFEIDGIADDVLTHFSTRSEQITCAEQDWSKKFTAEHGRAPSRVESIKARQFLTRATRPAKTVRPMADLLEDWANRTRALTGTPPHDLAARSLRGQYGRPLHAEDVGSEVRAAIVSQMLAEVSARRSVWTTWNLAAEALRASKPLRMASPSERRTLLDALTRQAAGECVHLDDTREPDTRRVGESRYTTAELLGAEKVLLDAAEPRTLPGSAYRGLQLSGQLPRHLADLAPDQAAAVQAIVASTRLLDALVGPAGSGKTTTLAALSQFWEGHVGPVTGLAPSATAAHTLGESLGIECETTAKWLYETSGAGGRRRAQTINALQDVVASGDPVTARRAREVQWRLVAEQRRWSFTAGQLVIIDEASLADTRTLAAVTQQAQAAGAKVLLVGDHLQRGAVDAGGAFAMLARRGPTAELTSLWRFTHAWEAHTSLELRHAQPSALDTYQQHGAFSAGALDDMLHTALDAAQAAAAQGRTAVLQAADTRTVRDLNARAHAAAVLAGIVTRHGVTLHDGLTAGIGDRIVTRHNNRRLTTSHGYVRNGDLWDITAINRDGSLRARPAGTSVDTATVRLPASYVADHVELGYATTTARSQGVTVDETHTIATPGMAREDLYVAMTRGRDHNHTYVALDVPDPDCPPGRRQPEDARAVLDRILATSHAELSATETWEAFHPAPPVDADALERSLYLPSARRPTDSLSARLSRTPPPPDRSPIGI